MDKMLILRAFTLLEVLSLANCLNMNVTNVKNCPIEPQFVLFFNNDCKIKYKYNNQSIYLTGSVNLTEPIYNIEVICLFES